MLVEIVAEHESRSVVGELEELTHAVAERAKEVVARLPAYDENTEQELETETPEDRPPSHLHRDTSTASSSPIITLYKLPSITIIHYLHIVVYYENSRHY